MATLTPITLTGSTLGARRRHLNALVTQAQLKNVSQEHIARLPESTPVDRLFKIQLASEGRHADYILQCLRDPDMLYVSSALRSAWLLDAEHSHIINPSYLEDKLYPQMTSPAVNKMKHWIHLNLRDTERCEGFFDYYSKKDFDSAIKFLPHCSNEFILTKVTDILDKLSPHYLKLLSEKCPEVAKIFFDSFSNNENVLTNYLNKEKYYYNNMRCLLKLNPDIFLDISEKYFNNNDFKTFSPAATKYVMNNCKDRFNRKPELYSAWLLNINTLAKCLSKDEAKDVVLKLAKAEYLIRWFSYQNVEPLIKRLPVEEQAAFKKQIFVDKSVGDIVQEWPYEPPSSPAEDSSGIHIFQDEEYNPREYENLGGALKARQKMRCIKRKMVKTNIISCEQKSPMEQLFDLYRFASFEKTLFELRRKMTVENLQNRQNMMLVLVSKSGGRLESIEVLLNLLIQRHENEPVHLRATVVRSLVKRCSAWRLPQGTWELMLRFGRDLGLDGKPPAAHCIEGLHAVVLRNILLDLDCDSSIWDAFLKDFSNFKVYSLTSAERRIVSAKLPALLLSNAEADPSQAIERLDQLLDTLDDFKIPAGRHPGVIPLIAVTARRDPKAESLLNRLFQRRVGRKELFKENFAIIQTDASYFNALKHDASILESAKEFEILAQTNSIKHQRFLRALALYFGEINGLAEKYLSVLERFVVTSPMKGLARPIALLSGPKLIRIVEIFDSLPDDRVNKQLSAALRASAHLARPLINIDAMVWELIGAKAIANIALTCSPVNVDHFIEKLLSCKCTHRLAFVLSMRIGKEYDILMNIAAKRSKFALKIALWHTRRGTNLDLRVWDIIISLILKLDTLNKLNVRLRKAIGMVDVVPSERKAEYCIVVFNIFKTISRNTAMPLLCHLEGMLPELDEKFIELTISDFLENEFTQTNVSKNHYDFKKRTRLYIRIIAKYLLLCKSETTQKSRLKTVGEPFFDRLEIVWKKAENDFILNFFTSSLKYNKVFLDTKYISCLPVFETLLSRLQKFLPVELNFVKYIHLHLTMLYFKSIRQSIKNNPEIFESLPKKLKEAVEIVGVIFGKYIARELKELKAKYFDSVVEFYKNELVSYVNDYFQYDVTRGLITGFIIKGILESDQSTHSLAESIYSQEVYNIPDSVGIQILDRLKESKIPEVKFFLYADLYC